MIIDTLPDLRQMQLGFQYTIEDKLREVKIRKPRYELLGVFMQTWKSTALGFEEAGGETHTSAYTTIIQSKDIGCVGVFFKNRLAYVIDNPNELFWEDLSKRKMKNTKDSIEYET